MKTITKPDHKYMEVADRIETLIENGVMKVGDKLLSVRALSKEQGISLSTAFQAYYFLESKGLIEARPQSGYYVKFTPKHYPELPTVCDPPEDAMPVTVDEMIASVYKDLYAKPIVNFALAAPPVELLPSAKLNKAIMGAIRNSETSCLHYEAAQGNVELRKQIARQAFNWGGTFKEDDIVVTAGCLEAISLCLRAVTKPGDAVAIESPTFFSFFQVMESMGLKVVEIPATPTTGIDLNYLEDAIKRIEIKACLCVPNFNNPMGGCMPDENKKRLVEMLSQKDIPLIEDDIYGELYFGKTRPRSCKSFDKKGMVLHCSSFSKSLSPGYRIGWTIPGKYKDEVVKLKRISTAATNTLAQTALASFLSNGRYELHLRHIRKELHTQSLRYAQAVSEYFPDDTRMTRPQGGFTLWVELNKKINSYKLFKKALKHSIGISPGQIFSSQGKFENCFRLSYGIGWNSKVEESVKTLGRLAREMK
jgi:DNA-binding transcriptional MocR family regulator